MKFKFIWYDMWVGFYWDEANRVLYFCPLPCCVITIPFKKDDDYYECFRED